MTNAQIQAKALKNAVSQQSTMNYEPIILGFIEKGIPAEDITPRENVFTFNAWKAQGRTVCKGEKGVKIVTWIKCKKKDSDETYMRPKTTTVFHVSQTKEI